MPAGTPADILALEDALDAAELDARALIAGLTEDRGAWRAETGSWSVAECLDHLATANRVYLHAMRPPADRALAHGRRRRGPAQPGIVGRWFVRTLDTEEHALDATPPASNWSAPGVTILSVDVRRVAVAIP